MNNDSTIDSIDGNNWADDDDSSGKCVLFSRGWRLWTAAGCPRKWVQWLCELSGGAIVWEATTGPMCNNSFLLESMINLCIIDK